MVMIPISDYLLMSKLAELHAEMLAELGKTLSAEVEAGRAKAMRRQIDASPDGKVCPIVVP